MASRKPSPPPIVLKEIIELDPTKQYIITVGDEATADALLEQIKASLDDSKGMRIAILVGDIRTVFSIEKVLDKK